MAYIGKIPAAAPLTSSDVADGIITNAKLAQDIISADTAGSAKYISEKNDKTESAIASSLAAEIYGLKIIAKHIEDDSKNVTRFLVMGKEIQHPELENKKYISSINSNIPIGRIGKLEDLVNAVNFLLSNGNSYFTGQSIIVDGGYTIW